MEKIRNFIIFVLVIVLLGGGFALHKSKPFRSAAKELNNLESVDFEVRLHLTSGSDSADSSDPLLFGLSGEELRIEGEYVGHQMHGNCYNGSDNTSFLEFYYDEDGEATVNVTPVLNFMLKNYAEENTIASLLINKVSAQLSDIAIKDSQFYKVTERHLMPDLPEMPEFETGDLIKASLLGAKVESSNFSDEISDMHFIKVAADIDAANTSGTDNGSISGTDDGYVYIGVGDVSDSGMQLYLSSSIDGLPFEALIDLSMPSSVEEIVIPENDITDEQLDILAKVYELVQPYLPQ